MRDISQSLRFEILRRDKFTCRYCGRSAPEVKLHVDHIIPRVHGGTSEAGNLVSACVECNSGKKDKMVSPMEVGGNLVESVKYLVDAVNEIKAKMEPLFREPESRNVVFVRHSAKCPRKNEGRYCRGCRCRKWIYVPTKRLRIPARTRSWEEAERRARIEA